MSVVVYTVVDFYWYLDCVSETVELMHRSIVDSMSMLPCRQSKKHANLTIKHYCVLMTIADTLS